MIQTLQALFAFILLLTSGLGLQRHHIASQMGQVESEVQLRATGAAAQLFDTFAVLPFDSNGTVSNAAALTPSDEFGGSADYASVTDLDDLDGLTGQIGLSSSGGSTTTYEWTASVRYVAIASGNFAASPGSSPTYQKEVVLTLTGPADVALTTSRIYSYNG